MKGEDDDAGAGGAQGNGGVPEPETPRCRRRFRGPCVAVMIIKDTGQDGPAGFYFLSPGGSGDTAQDGGVLSATIARFNMASDDRGPALT